jgi:hypothetical protein
MDIRHIAAMIMDQRRYFHCFRKAMNIPENTHIRENNNP